MQSQSFNLAALMTDGTMRAYVLHAREQGLSTVTDETVTELQQAIITGWDEFKATLKTALDANMGDAMCKTIMNTYCNSWTAAGVKAAMLQQNPSASFAQKAA